GAVLPGGPLGGGSRGRARAEDDQVELLRHPRSPFAGTSARAGVACASTVLPLVVPRPPHGRRGRSFTSSSTSRTRTRATDPASSPVHPDVSHARKSLVPRQPLRSRGCRPRLLSSPIFAPATKRRFVHSSRCITGCSCASRACTCRRRPLRKRSRR